MYQLPKEKVVDVAIDVLDIGSSSRSINTGEMNASIVTRPIRLQRYVWTQPGKVRHQVAKCDGTVAVLKLRYEIGDLVV